MMSPPVAGNSHLINGVVEELFMQDSLAEIQDMFMDVCDALRENLIWGQELDIWKRMSDFSDFQSSGEFGLNLLLQDLLSLGCHIDLDVTWSQVI